MRISLVDKAVQLTDLMQSNPGLDIGHVVFEARTEKLPMR
jgi:hypothetical protein